MSFPPNNLWHNAGVNQHFQRPQGSFQHNTQHQSGAQTGNHNWPRPPSNGLSVNAGTNPTNPINSWQQPHTNNYNFPSAGPHPVNPSNMFHNRPPNIPHPPFNQNPPRNVPPPSFHQQKPSMIRPPSSTYQHVQPPSYSATHQMNTSHQASHMSNYPAGLNGPPPPLGAAYPSPGIPQFPPHGPPPINNQPFGQATTPVNNQPFGQTALPLNHQPFGQVIPPVNNQPFSQPARQRFPYVPNEFQPVPLRQKIEVEKKDGCTILEQWFNSNRRPKKSQLKHEEATKKDNIQIGSFMTGVKEMNTAIASLSDQVNKMMSAVSTMDETSWQDARAKCDQMKEKLSVSSKVHLGDNHVEKVQKKLSKVRDKRARLKRLRAAKFEERLEREQEWAEKSKTIDKWQDGLRIKIQEENKEKKRKLAADRTLSKVTREIHDATRLIDTMLALQKLRLIRRDAAQKRGDTDIGESRQQFEEKIKDMTRLVHGQLECYKTEEAKLKQFLKSEEEEKTKKEQQVKEDEAKKLDEEEDIKLRSCLFGPNDAVLPNDAVFPFKQYYLQAEHNLSAFLQIRQEWDSFLVPKGTPASSSIPSTWVIPDKPSSSVWATALN